MRGGFQGPGLFRSSTQQLIKFLCTKLMEIGVSLAEQLNVSFDRNLEIFIQFSAATPRIAPHQQHPQLKVPVERYWYRCSLQEYELVPEIENDSIIILVKT